MSSQDDWDDPYRDEFRKEDFEEQDPWREDLTEPRPAKKMNPALKAVIVILCLIGAGTLLCCGGIALVVSKIYSGISDEPEVVNATTQEIVEITIPDSYLPGKSLSADLPLVPSLKIATHERRDGKGQLMLVGIGMPLEADDAAAEQQMKQTLRDQGFDLPQLDVDETSVEFREFTIRGQMVDVKFAKATGVDTNEAVRVVEAFFNGPDGMVMMLLAVSEDAYDEAEVERILRSIQ